MTTGLLKAGGLWLGKTVPGGPSNPDGFFENIALREGMTKPLLRDALGVDPLGVRSLPAENLPIATPQLRRHVARALASDGYDGQQAWGYKGAKMALLWPLWAEAFPNAHWVIVSRNNDDVMRSCLNTHFMGQHSSDPAFWTQLHRDYATRLDNLARSVPDRVTRLRYEDLRAGDFSALSTLCVKLGLTWTDSLAQGFVR